MRPHQHERLSDEVKNADTPIRILGLILSKWGLVGAIAAFLVYDLTFKQAGQIDKVTELVQQHVYESRYMQRASCISLAVLSGTSPALCDPPSPH